MNCLPARLLAALMAVGIGANAVGAAPVPGQLVIDPENVQCLKREGGGHVFICGPGDPENFLYRGERNADGTRRGDQVELIEKLARHGGNCIYLQAVRTHGGDAKKDGTQNPFVDSDPAQPLDADILDQWEEWFARMDRHDILIYFEFYDDGARIWDTGDEVGEPERRFFEELVRRFKHHRNLIWIIGEETDERYTVRRVRALAEVIRAADDHGHIIGSHHLSSTTFRPWEPGSALTHFSMQLTVKLDGVHAGSLEARAKAANRYQVFYAEDTAIAKDDDSMRRFAWAVAMAGLNPMILQMDIASTSIAALSQCRTLQRFFEKTDFFRMSPHDELAAGATRYVLADAGRSYIAYADAAGELGLKALPAGECVVSWVDCRDGRTATTEERFPAAGDRVFTRPPQFGDECAAWIRFTAASFFQAVPQASAPQHPPAAAPNRPPQVSDRELSTRRGAPVEVQLHFLDDDGPGPYAYTIVEPPRHGRLSGTDNDRVYTPQPGFVGTDSFSWRVHDAMAPSAVARITIRIE